MEHHSVSFSVIQVSLLILVTSPHGLTLCLKQGPSSWELCGPDSGAGLSLLDEEGCDNPAGQEDTKRNTQVSAPRLSNTPSSILPLPPACLAEPATLV